MMTRRRSLRRILLASMTSSGLRKWVVALALIACAVSSQARGQTLVSKTTIVGNVVHYYWLLTTSSPAPFNQVGVHRIVEQNGDGPIRSTVPVFLAHGAFGTFKTDFMMGSFSPKSLPVYLANQGVDVWGIDYAWSLVPPNQTNFAFMQGWDLQRDINDLEAAIAFARQSRVSTGSDGSRLNLAGFSQSGWTGYALLNEEASLSCTRRNVKGFIALDGIFVTNDKYSKKINCQEE